MVTLEIPHVNIMTKVDVLTPAAKDALETYADPSNYCQFEEKSPHGSKYTALANSLYQWVPVIFLDLDRSDKYLAQARPSLVGFLASWIKMGLRKIAPYNVELLQSFWVWINSMATTQIWWISVVNWDKNLAIF